MNSIVACLVIDLLQCVHTNMEREFKISRKYSSPCAAGIGEESRQRYTSTGFLHYWVRRSETGSTRLSWTHFWQWKIRSRLPQPSRNKCPTAKCCQGFVQRWSVDGTIQRVAGWTRLRWHQIWTNARIAGECVCQAWTLAACARSWIGIHANGSGRHVGEYIASRLIHFMKLFSFFFLSHTNQGNKGAVSIRFSLYGVSMCVVNAHLAAHDHMLDERVKDFEKIVDEHKFHVKGTQEIFQHE